MRIVRGLCRRSITESINPTFAKSSSPTLMHYNQSHSSLRGILPVLAFIVNHFSRFLFPFILTWRFNNMPHRIIYVNPTLKGMILRCVFHQSGQNICPVRLYSAVSNKYAGSLTGITSLSKTQVAAHEYTPFKSPSLAHFLTLTSAIYECDGIWLWAFSGGPEYHPSHNLHTL